MGKLRIAIPTKNQKGLEDVVSEVFGKARFFTIVDMDDAEIEKVQIVENPAASYKYGSGPVAVKTLADLAVKLVLGPEFGPGASNLLELHEIRKILVEPNTRVADSLKKLSQNTT
jgi:predicted Fe-Mo cluster-binding NifX family protein